MSNAMLRASLRKIKSAPKLSLLLGGGLVLVIVGGALMLHGMNVQPDTSLTRLSIGKASYHLEVAADAAAQEKGLGNRIVMDANHGMLFTFGADDQRCFWMKDMHFPL